MPIPNQPQPAAAEPVRDPHAVEVGVSLEDERRYAPPTPPLSPEIYWRSILFARKAANRVPARTVIIDPPPLQDVLRPLDPDELNAATIGMHYIRLTLKQALWFLARNDQNRPMLTQSIVDLVGIARRGEWTQQFEPIVLSENDRVGEGQHRCAAVVAADMLGWPIEPVVAYAQGGSDELIRHLGKSRRRTAADALAMTGVVSESQRNAAAAAGRMLFDLQKFAYDRVPAYRNIGKLSDDQVWQLVVDNPDLVTAADYTRGGKLGKYTSPAASAVLRYLTYAQDPEASDAFFGKVAGVVPAADDEPARQLALWLRPADDTLRRQRGGLLTDRRLLLSIWFRAYKTQLRGAPFKKLQFAKELTFPVSPGDFSELTPPLNRADANGAAQADAASPIEVDRRSPQRAVVRIGDEEAVVALTARGEALLGLLLEGPVNPYSDAVAVGMGLAPNNARRSLLVVRDALESAFGRELVQVSDEESSVPTFTLKL